MLSQRLAEARGNGGNQSFLEGREGRMQPPVERHGIQDIRGLRAAVRDERVILRSLETRIVEIDVRETMTGGREIDDASARLE